MIPRDWNHWLCVGILTNKIERNYGKKVYERCPSWREQSSCRLKLPSDNVFSIRRGNSDVHSWEKYEEKLDMCKFLQSAKTGTVNDKR